MSIGDRDDPASSFTQFVHDNGETMLQGARRITAGLGLPRGSAEDVRSEALTRAWANWSTIDSGRRLGWTFRTMGNVALEQYNRQKLDRKHSCGVGQEFTIDQVPSSQPLPPDVVIACLSAPQISQIVATILAEIPEDHRTVFMLARAGMNSKEIARELHIPSGTVRSQLSRLTRRIKIALTRAALMDLGLPTQEGGTK